MKKPYTAKLLKQFDRLTLKLSSRDQLERIMARFEVREFEEKHGREVCQAMFDTLTRRDNDARRATGRKDD